MPALPAAFTIILLFFVPIRSSLENPRGKWFHKGASHVYKSKRIIPERNGLLHCFSACSYFHVFCCTFEKLYFLYWFPCACTLILPDGCSTGILFHWRFYPAWNHALNPCAFPSDAVGTFHFPVFLLQHAYHQWCGADYLCTVYHTGSVHGRAKEVSDSSYRSWNHCRQSRQHADASWQPAESLSLYDFRIIHWSFCPDYTAILFCICYPSADFYSVSPKGYGFHYNCCKHCKFYKYCNCFQYFQCNLWSCKST